MRHTSPQNDGLARCAMNRREGVDDDGASALAVAFSQVGACAGGPDNRIGAAHQVTVRAAGTS